MNSVTDENGDGLARLVAGLLERAEELGDAQAEGIRAVANDHGGGFVPVRELGAACAVELRNILGALTGGRPLNTEICAEIGRRRARQHVPESTLVAGYRVGIRFVWELLIAEAAATGLVDHEGLVARSVVGARVAPAPTNPRAIPANAQLCRARGVRSR